jgi:glycerol uptake facilitator-like aquaporin
MAVSFKKYLAEFIGTFALVFCGTGAIIINQETLWIYLTATTGGAAVAIPTWKYLNLKDKNEDI